MRQETRDLIACEENGIATGIAQVLRDVRRLHDRVRVTPDDSPGALREVQRELEAMISRYTPVAPVSKVE